VAEGCGRRRQKEEEKGQKRIKDERIHPSMGKKQVLQITQIKKE
jgi:hypothetical protein